MPPSDPRLRELGAFLRVRRAEVRPQEVGLAHAGPVRQVAGLRREEVAGLAFTSNDHYRRIEQGRAAPSAELLESLIEVLRLDADQQNYVRALQAAGPLAPPVSAARDDSLEMLAHHLADVAAFVINPYTRILAWNDMVVDLLGRIDLVPEHRRTYACLLFTEPDFQARFANLDQMQEFAVGVMRSASVETEIPAEERDLIGAVARTSPKFKSLWEDRVVAYPKGSLRVPMKHPTQGEMSVRQVALQSPDPPFDRLISFIPETFA